jgi:ubiquitin-protein ligase
MKDYQIVREFKALKNNVPNGVYVLPSFDSLREWSGVIFLRQGLYQKGIFRFRIDIPME